MELAPVLCVQAGGALEEHSPSAGWFWLGQDVNCIQPETEGEKRDKEAHSTHPGKGRAAAPSTVAVFTVGASLEPRAEQESRDHAGREAGLQALAGKAGERSLSRRQS